ncbi:S41 family peptidase [Salinibacter ruber]|uniref:Tail specific protease domain-containing protein n=1 Tax=Salinibacter ruber TaxID=146919 RepID=A0A9X2Z495_9BACT|nr:S41 family peptidase [Salinibacter ruber]MCS3656530.1 hypothetical protein [Salinibacter ruber]MCS3951543.1 hypothetical protein [Salinibacter ruber]MCS4117738.1 hypothetical protein [Salinibacter ruber]MCS4154647.1 hypothetical protein [Salinibacter ruber]MCS4170045.1 hypothetical protein [Salinibacter ruber]
MSRTLRIFAVLLVACIGLAAASGWYYFEDGWLRVAAWRAADAETATRYDLDEDAYAYLNRALVAMRYASLRRDSLDWPALRRAAFDEARGARTPEDTYPALRLALDRLKDGHSFFDPPGDASPTADAAPDSGEATAPAPDEWPTARSVTASDGARLGYVHVPKVMGPGEQAYADSLRGAVRALTSNAPPCGWIVDVRGNVGGSMWPMLAGLGPVIGPGRLGASVEASGDRRPWFYDDGRAGAVYLGGWYRNVSVEVEAPPHRLDPPHPPVAVLTDSRTASAGEAVAVAFRGRRNARSFGASTAGKTTSNQTVYLPDGARLFVTAAVYADRTGRVYGGPLAPDVRSTAPEADARSWLAQQPECSGNGGA